jgi:sec-independent protein translocase protein TatA
LIVVIIALVLFGGTQLPKLARNFGEAKKELNKAMKDGDETAKAGPTSESPKASDSASDGAGT